MAVSAKDKKWARAKQLIDENHTNSQLHNILVEEFGSGVGTSSVAEWRKEAPDRVKAAIALARTELAANKRALITNMLVTGHSSYACQLACKKQFGTSVGYDLIKKIQHEMASAPPAIVPVDLPPEMLDDTPAVPEDPYVSMMESLLDDTPAKEAKAEPVEDDLQIVPPHGPNGALTNIRVIQRWMAGINAESLTLTQDGKLSVLARHEFDIGGI